MSRSPFRLLPLALLSGILMAVSFPLGEPLPLRLEAGFWPAAWLCLSPLLVAATRAGRAAAAAAWGLIAGAVAHGAILIWLHPFLVRWARVSAPEAWGILTLLVLYLAAYVALFSWCVALWSRRWGPSRALLLSPFCWTALELARGRALTGFPWALLGYSQQPAPIVIQVADLAGVYGVSLLLAAASALAALPLCGRRAAAPAGPERSRRTTAGALAAIVAAGLLYGLWRIGETAGEPDRRLAVALIQANVPQAEKWDPGERERIELDHARMTVDAAGEGASLVIWSESAVPAPLQADYAARLEDLARRTGSDLLVGTVVYEPRPGGGRAPYNSAVLVRPETGVTGRYDKTHLVPFGEYVPLKDLLSFLEPLVHEASDFHAGATVLPLEGRGARIGTLICYEAIFPEIARAHARAGADLLVNITNDAWYGDTAMPRQHLGQSVLRAVETRRWLLRCANTGISAIVGPDGRIAARAPFEKRITLAGTVAPSRRTTWYVAAGDAVAIACAILTAAALLLVLRGAHSGDAHAR